MTRYLHLLIQQHNAVAEVTLNRPDAHNAFDETLIAELTDCVTQLSEDAAVRVIVLRGAGASFCAGADLSYMGRMAGYTPEENRTDARALQRMFAVLANCPQVTIARVQGAALGGGAGLAAVCDITIAAEDARFAFSEARLGLAPAVIAPYVLQKMSPGAARALFVTGERFSAAEAWRLGLAQQMVPAAELDAAVQRTVEAAMQAGPEAVAAIKRLLREHCRKNAGGSRRHHQRVHCPSAGGGGRAGRHPGISGKAPSGVCPAMKRPVKRLLIANRGEIAVRIIRACRQRGVSPVAVYSEADRDAPYVALADAAYPLGPGPAAESYLRIDKILDAARQAGADAVHPGYGFLSENADFAQACAEAGLTFVGPPASVIRLLGDKGAAKRLMAAAGVPVVPGYHGDDQSEARLRQEAGQIGTPLLIKAAAGGGGRGMRLVDDLAQFAGLCAEARREAQAAFGDGRLLLERYIARPRHVEFQIFGDSHGNLVHLFERECSVQRRHQKIIEESPSPALTPDLRAAMASAALSAGRAAGYVNAGTVEFLLEETPDGPPRFYFLEVNTRLQVEHPVTELLTGLDLVQLQLQVADGEALPWTQDRVTARGHALEVRIYAEDPATGFLPSVGRLAQWVEPTGPGVRVDSGVERGSEVSPYYDPMLAKLIVQGGSRAEALARMSQALENFHVLGVQTNIAYLLAIIRHPAFQAGELSTGFLAEHFANWAPRAEVPNDVLLALTGEVVTLRETVSSGAATMGDGDPYTPWRAGGGWRNTG